VLKSGKRNEANTRMTYKQVKKLKAEDFKRLSGIRLETFNQMVEIVKKAESSRKKTVRPSKLRVEDKILMTARVFARVPNLFSSRCDLGS
jgi:hypothetical protein